MDEPKLTPEQLQTVKVYWRAMCSPELRQKYPALAQASYRLQRWDDLQRLRYFYFIEQQILDEVAAPWMIDLQTTATLLRITS